MKIKKLAALVLAAALALSPGAAAHAAEGDALAAADSLNALGLFAGTGTDENGEPVYELERGLTRQEAIIMLLRLLGRIDAAKAGIWDMPFADVSDWAAPYVGYAYENGLAFGTGDTTFGAEDPITATQYLSFVLRALGYSSAADFKWDAAWELSDALGVTSGEYGAENNASFVRGDAAIVSLDCLGAQLKDGETTLIARLVEDGAVSREAAEAEGLLEPELPSWSYDEATGEYRFPATAEGVSAAQLMEAFPDAVYFSRYVSPDEDDRLSVAPDPENAPFYASASAELLLSYVKGEAPGAENRLDGMEDITIYYEWDGTEDEQVHWIYLYDGELDGVAEYAGYENGEVIFKVSGHSAREFFEELDGRYEEALAGCVPGAVKYEQTEPGKFAVTDYAGSDPSSLRRGDITYSGYDGKLLGLTREQYVEYRLREMLVQMFFYPGALRGEYDDNGEIVWHNKWFSADTELRPMRSEGDGEQYGFSFDYPEGYASVLVFYEADGSIISYELVFW